MPFTQGFGLVLQAPPEVQLQLPLPLQAFCPEVPVHAVPGAALPVMFVHADTPVAQDVVAVWQTLAGVQDVPAVHDTHEPLSQTRLVPQPVPLATLPEEMQLCEPDEQSVLPVWQLE